MIKMTSSKDDPGKEKIKLLKCSITKIKFEEGNNKGQLRSAGFRFPKSFIKGPGRGFAIGTFFIPHEEDAIEIAKLLKTSKKKTKTKTKSKLLNKKKRSTKTIDDILDQMEDQGDSDESDEEMESEIDEDIENKEASFEDMFF